MLGIAMPQASQAAQRRNGKHTASADRGRRLFETQDARLVLQARQLSGLEPYARIPNESGTR